MRKWIFSGLIAVCAFLVVVVTVRKPSYDLLQMGTFVVLVLTLLALIFYAFDTNLLAEISRKNWERETILKAHYYMQGTNDQGGAGRIVFGIGNPTTLLLRAKVRCNFKVNNPVNYTDDYDGISTWYIFPQQTSQGWFEIERVLQRAGRTVEGMCSESSETNQDQQLTMDLEIEFRDELGNERKLPSRRHYFAFNDWRWIPELTKRDDWS